MPTHEPDVWDESREYVHEMIGMVTIHAGLVQAYAEIRDDLGMEYALRRLVAHVKAATGTFNAMKESKKKALVDAHVADEEQNHGSA